LQDYQLANIFFNPTQKPTLGWNGEYKNSLVSEGVYLVKITFKANDNVTGTNPYFYWSGTVQVLR